MLVFLYTKAKTLKGKVAVITGGSGTLGQAFAKGLAQKDATVFILNRNKEKANIVRNEFKEKGLTIHAVSYTHLTLPTLLTCRSRWSPYH